MKNLLLIAGILLTTALYAQNPVSGKVLDPKGNPVRGAVINLMENSTSTVSDSLGAFTFDIGSSQSLRVSVSHSDFELLETTIRSTTASPVIFRLAEKSHILDEVMVSSPFNRIRSENVMKIEHITLDNLEQTGATTLIEGLAMVPGLSQISTGHAIGKPVIRGLSGNRVVVYSQGLRVENQQFGDEHGLGLNGSGIESVEIIKGPASLLYGSDAIGGVLYFNPQKFAAPDTYELGVDIDAFANTQGIKTSLNGAKSFKNWHLLGSVGTVEHADYKVASGRRVTNTRYNEFDAKFAIGVDTKPYKSALRYNYNKLNIGLPEDGIAEQSASKDLMFPQQQVASHLLSLQNTFRFAGSSLDADFGYQLNDRAEFEEKDEIAIDMKLQTLSYNVRYNKTFGDRFKFIAGTQGMHQENKNFGEEALIPDAVTTDIGIYTTANYDMDKSSLLAGIRWDSRRIEGKAAGIDGEPGSFESLDRTFENINASIGYRLNVTQKAILRLNLASGFRAPNLSELTSNGVHEGTNRYEIGNNSLDSETNFQADVNIEYRTSHVDFFVNVFSNTVSGFIYLSPTADEIDGHQVFTYNASDAHLYGGEAGVHFHPHPLDWLHFESSFQTVTGKRSNKDHLPLIPADNWNNTVRANFKIGSWLQKGFGRINVSHTFAQTQTALLESRTGSYTLANIGAGGEWKTADATIGLSVNCNNLFNESFIPHLSRFKNDGIPSIGRNISVGLSVSL